MANAIKAKTPRPAQVRDAVERGQMLRHLVEQSGVSVTTLAQRAGLMRSAFYQYFKGSPDLADVTQETAQAILKTLNLRDEEAWRTFNLPEEVRPKWTTSRAAPFGQGVDTRDMVSVLLQEALLGEIAVPAGSVLQVDRNNHAHGILLMRLTDGQLMAVRPALAHGAGGEILGQLVAVDFATVLPAGVRTPGQAAS